MAADTLGVLLAAWRADIDSVPIPDFTQLAEALAPQGGAA